MNLFGYTIIKVKHLEDTQKKLEQTLQQLNDEQLTNRRLRRELATRTDYVNNVRKILLEDTRDERAVKPES